MSEIVIPGVGTLRVERHMVDVTTAFVQDQRWRHVDSHGHEHAWTDGTDSYPTLEWVNPRRTLWEWLRRLYPDGYMACKRCGDRVSPGIVPSTGRQYIEGRKAYFLNDEPISEDIYHATLAMLRD